MKKPLPPKRPNTNYVPVLMGVFVFVLTALMYNMYRAQVFSRLYRFPFLNSPKPTPTPTPIVLPPGKETYSVSQGPHKGPSISQVVFDPLDVHKGQQLTLSVTVGDTTPVTDVTGLLQTDRGKQKFTLTKGDQEDVWVGTVIPDNTLWYTYVLTITAKSSGGTSVATVAPRS